MDLPGLRHFRNEGIFFIFSDPVEALQGEAWVPAVYTDKGWATADGSTLLSSVEAWRYAEETNQGGTEDRQSNEGVQSRDSKKRQTGTRKRTNSQKP